MHEPVAREIGTHANKEAEHQGTYAIITSTTVNWRVEIVRL